MSGGGDESGALADQQAQLKAEREENARKQAALDKKRLEGLRVRLSSGGLFGQGGPPASTGLGSVTPTQNPQPPFPPGG